MFGEVTRCMYPVAMCLPGPNYPLCRWETTNLTVAYNTPLEVIEQLKSRLRQYMADNNREWGSTYTFFEISCTLY